MNKICKTNPISRKPKMNVTPCPTITNNNEQRTMNYLKRTQTKPILESIIRLLQYPPAGFQPDKFYFCRCALPPAELCQPVQKARRLLSRHAGHSPVPRLLSEPLCLPR